MCRQMHTKYSVTQRDSDLSFLYEYTFITLIFESNALEILFLELNRIAGKETNIFCNACFFVSWKIMLKPIGAC